MYRETVADVVGCESQLSRTPTEQPKTSAISKHNRYVTTRADQWATARSISVVGVVQ
jgi:hypothetical protein